MATYFDRIRRTIIADTNKSIIIGIPTAAKKQTILKAVTLRLLTEAHLQCALRLQASGRSSVNFTLTDIEPITYVANVTSDTNRPIELSTTSWHGNLLLPQFESELQVAAIITNYDVTASVELTTIYEVKEDK